MGEKKNGKLIEEVNRIHSFFFIFKLTSFPQTPLHLAAGNGLVDCVNILIKLGADVAVKTVRNKRVRDLWDCVIY